VLSAAASCGFRSEDHNPGWGRVLIVDRRTGSTREVTPPNGLTWRFGWLDPHALNMAAQAGAQSPLFRLTYPAGTATRLTNDPNDYAGISSRA
jgi:hypothetical protein